MTTMSIPLVSAPRAPRSVALRRRLALTTLAFLLFTIALLAGRTVLAAPDGSPASVAGRSQTSSEPADAALVPLGAQAALAGELPSATGQPEPLARAGGLYLVQEGDTLASIAAELAPEGLRQRFVADLIALNGDAPLVAGERLVLPA
jgi:Tfp pilus assembly protein FimV